MIPRTHVHTEIIVIRWGDMDAMAHVNNTLYFRYMETARIAWFEALGVRSDPRGQGPVVINARCTFLKPLVYPGSVELKTYAGAAGRSSFETWYEMRPNYAPETVYAEGQAKVVWVDAGQGKSAPLPDAIRAMIRGSDP